MRLGDELEALQQRLDELERGPATVGDWHRFEARVARAMIAAHQGMLRCGVSAITDLCVMRLSAQRHLCLLQAGDVRR